MSLTDILAILTFVSGSGGATIAFVYRGINRNTSKIELLQKDTSDIKKELSNITLTESYKDDSIRKDLNSFKKDILNEIKSYKQEVISTNNILRDDLLDLEVKFNDMQTKQNDLITESRNLRTLILLIDTKYSAKKTSGLTEKNVIQKEIEDTVKNMRF